MTGLEEIGVALLRLDTAGRVLDADRRVADLNIAAGGREGAALALPAIAAIARLSRRLGIVIARAAVVADGDEDLSLWVRAEPAPDETRLQISGWRGRADRHPIPFEAAEADFDWETDGAMCLTSVSIDADDTEALVGQSLTRVFDLEQDDALVHVLTAAANRMAFVDQPARLRSDGRELHLSGRASVDMAGRFVGFVGTGRFVAAVAPVAPVDRQFTDRLDSALRTPLQRIVAHADSIGAQAEGPVRSEYVEYAHDIASAARHLMGLIDDLVDLSAIERPDFHVEAERIDLADVARRAAGLLSVRAADAEVRIERPGAKIELPATGEFRRALQIAVNLIGNAVRYSPRGGVVRVGLDRMPDRVAVTIADSGKGIAHRDQARIFEKFGRVDPTEAGGNGLGLYIARRLARAMGGDVTVESEAGQGARFTLTLPAG